jgi:hypothetical protein
MIDPAKMSDSYFKMVVERLKKDNIYESVHHALMMKQREVYRLEKELEDAHALIKTLQNTVGVAATLFDPISMTNRAALGEGKE